MCQRGVYLYKQKNRHRMTGNIFLGIYGTCYIKALEVVLDTKTKINLYNAVLSVLQRLPCEAT